MRTILLAALLLLTACSTTVRQKKADGNPFSSGRNGAAGEDPKPPSQLDRDVPPPVRPR